MPQVINIPTPFIRKGDPITAKGLCQLADAVRVVTLQPGQFQNGRLRVMAPQPRRGSSSGKAVGITSSGIPAGQVGEVTITRGTASSTSWLNDSGKDIPPGYKCVADDIDGMYIHSAFCPNEGSSS